MVFSQFGKDVISLTRNFDTLNIVTNKQNNDILLMVDRFNELKSEGKLVGNTFDNLFGKVKSIGNDNLTYYFQSVAEGAENARVNIVDAYAAILDGNTHGLKNVQSIMNTFNNSFDGSVEKQRKFTQAVGQSNQGLAAYLNSIEKGGTATLKGYAGQLVATTAKTIGLQLATVALQAAISVGLSLAIMGLTTAISEAVVTQKELRQAAIESADEFDNQVEAIKNLKTEYLAIIDSDKTSIEKTEELNTWKQTLIDTYGDEYEALQTLNDERERGVEILDAEIQKTARAARDEWIGANDKAIEKAVEKYYDVNSNIGSIQGKYMSTTIDIPESVQKLLDINYQHTHGATYFNFGIDAENIEEQYDKIGQAIEILSNKKQRLGELNEYEQQLLDLLNKKYSKVGKTIEENSSIYDKYFKSVAQNKFEDYVATADGDIENVGKDTYLAWKNGLLKTAENNSKGVQDELTALIEQQFPDYEKYFDNLEKAREQFGVTAPNSADEAKKRAFIDKLSPEDLEIVVNNIPDLFADGLDGATKKIEEWKADPNNKITADVDTKTLEELQEAYDELSKSASTYVSNQKTINSALEEQEKYGQLSASTIQELTEAGYAQALVVDSETGAVTLNKQAYEQLNEQKKQKIKLDLIAEKSTLEDKLKDEQKAVSDLKQEYKSLKNANSQLFAGRLLEITDELAKRGESITAISELIDKINGSISSLDAPTFGDGKKETPDEIQKFLDDYAQYRHDITMGIKKEDEDYFNWLEKASYDAYSKYPDYLDDLWKYEEEVYKGRKKLAEDFYDSQRDYYKDRVSDLESQIEITTKDSTDNNGNLLNAEEKFAYIRSVYSDILATIQEDINDIVQNGIEGHEDDLKELEQQYEKYVREMADVFKDEVESEIKYIQNLQDTAEKAFDDKIDKIEAEKKAMEDRYDAEIDKIDSVIDSIESKNKSEKLTNDLIKARQDLEKANRNKRLVFDSSGNQQYVADTKAVSEAQQTVKEAEQAITVNKLQEVKEAIEDEKTVLSKSYDNQLTELKDQKEKQKDFYDNLIKTLQDYIDPKQTTSNTNVWNTVAGEDGAVKVGDSEMSTSYIDSRISSDDAVKNIYEQMLRNSAWSDTDIDKALKDYDITKLLTTLVNNNYKALGVNEALAGSSVTNTQSYVNNNGNVTVNVKNDINISGNETDGRKIANEIIQEMTRQLPNAFTQQMYRNN